MAAKYLKPTSFMALDQHTEVLQSLIMSTQEVSSSGSILYTDRAEIARDFSSLFAKTQLLQKEILFLAGLIVLVACGGWAIFMHIDSGIDEVKRDIHNLSVEVATIKTDVVVIKGDIVEMQGDIAGMQRDIAGIQGDIAGIQSDIAEIQEHIKEFQGDVAELKEGR